MEKNYYELLLESVRDYAVFLLDTDGRIRYANPALQEINGYSPEEVTGQSYALFYREEERDQMLVHALATAQAAGRFEEERWQLRSDGTVFWCNSVFTPVRESADSLTGYSCLSRDLTGRKLAEQELRESEERTRLMVEGVKDYAIFMLDPQGHIASWNEGARRIKGYESREIIGRHFSTFYTREDIEDGKPARELKIAIKTGKYEEEGWRVRKDGSLFWANVLITAIFDDRQRLIGFCKVTRDLTERRKAEQALRDSEERYRDLAIRLNEANKELAFTNSELEQFTSMVSHDLQEPLRTISSYLDLILVRQGAEIKPEVRNYIEKAIGGSIRMRELIKNLLHYSQVSWNEIRFAEVPVGDLISEALQNLKSSIETTGAEIMVENHLDTVQGDRVQLVQLIQNITGNAIKFRGDRRPKVQIRADREGNFYHFSISDNGIGIAPEHQERIFEIFNRLHTRQEYPGTGIGLAICKKIVERHAGRIWMESEPGSGTTFHFTLQHALSTIPERVEKIV